MKKLIITGFVGAEPKKVVLANEKFFVSINLAVQSGTRANPTTEWFEILCYDRYADLALDYIKKGTKILVESNRFNIRSYKKKDGSAAASFNVIADYIEFLSNKEQISQTLSMVEESKPLTSDDVPF